MFGVAIHVHDTHCIVLSVGTDARATLLLHRSSKASGHVVAMLKTVVTIVVIAIVVAFARVGTSSEYIVSIDVLVLLLTVALAKFLGLQRITLVMPMMGPPAPLY